MEQEEKASADPFPWHGWTPSFTLHLLSAQPSGGYKDVQANTRITRSVMLFLFMRKGQDSQEVDGDMTLLIADF